MNQLLLTQRILECEENGWNDLLSRVDEISQSLIDNPSAGRKIRIALLVWCDSVDCRVNALPPDEDTVFHGLPALGSEIMFGTEV